MQVAEVTRLINSNEMFLNYYPKESHIIAPVNMKRVGSNQFEDSKKGRTVMVGCKMIESKLIVPYLVMTATRDGTLSCQSSNWDNLSKITFHPKYWMDKLDCLQYL